jgi:serine/threonine-protein kinase
MGTVWLAHDRSLDRACALKILDPEKAGDEELRKRFLREARSTGQIRSANVVEVFEHGIWDGLPFIVMEFLDGEELAECLERRGPLAPLEVHRVVAQIARALVRAHALGIVHRDLKPENVFLVPTEGDVLVKLLDFGIARHVIYSPRDHATQAGAVLGTPCYMSPEQALGEPTDYRSDLWALGVLTFQCLTGSLPFMHEALGGLLAQILYEPIPSIGAANPALPPAVEAWWRKAAERDPKRRFQSARELSDELAWALGVTEPLAVPSLEPCSQALDAEPGAFEDASQSAADFAARMASDVPVAMDTGELISQFRRKVTRRSVWGVGLLVALLSALVGAALWFRDRLPPWREATRVDERALARSLPPPMPTDAGLPKVAPPPVLVVPVPISALPPEPAPAPSASAPGERPKASVQHLKPAEPNTELAAPPKPSLELPRPPVPRAPVPRVPRRRSSLSGGGGAGERDYGI